MKLAVQVAGAVAPEWLADKAFLLFGKPQRLVGRWADLADTARRFELDTGTEKLTAWEWNSAGRAGTALLVHGWSGNASQMRAFVHPLTQRGFHVVAVDLPAHGQTDGSFATIVSLSDTLVALGRRLTPKLIVAHSLGATATTYALTKGLHVERLVLLAPAVELPPYLRHFAEQFGLNEAMQAKVLQRVERYIGKPVSEMDLRRHASGFGAVKMMLLHDAEDFVTSQAAGRELVSVWPGAVFHETTGLGHDGVRKDPRVVNDVVEFLLAGRHALRFIEGSAESVTR